MREFALLSILDRGTPSANAKRPSLEKFQQSTRLDAVYNYRPVTLSPLSVSIYEPVFSQFMRDVSLDPKSFEHNHEDLTVALETVSSFMELFRSEELKQRVLSGLSWLMGERGSFLAVTSFYRDTGPEFRPDGHRMSYIPALGLAVPSEIIEVKNEIGEGGSDAITQAECDYLCFHDTAIVSLIFHSIYYYANTNATLCSVFQSPCGITLPCVTSWYKWASHRGLGYCFC